MIENPARCRAPQLSNSQDLLAKNARLEAWADHVGVGRLMAGCDEKTAIQGPLHCGENLGGLKGRSDRDIVRTFALQSFFPC